MSQKTNKKKKQQKTTPVKTSFSLFLILGVVANVLNCNILVSSNSSHVIPFISFTKIFEKGTNAYIFFSVPSRILPLLFLNKDILGIE